MPLSFQECAAGIKRGEEIPFNDFLELCAAAVDILAQKWPDPVARLDSNENYTNEEVVVIGPTRAHVHDTLDVIERHTAGVARSSWPAFVFLGDYIDGGVQSTEHMAMLLAFLIEAPERVVLLRGRQELLFPEQTWRCGPSGRAAEELRHGSVRAVADAFRKVDAQWEPDSTEVFKAETSMIHESQSALSRLFVRLPACCVIGGRYFAACGGIGLGMEKMSLASINEELGRARVESLLGINKSLEASGSEPISTVKVAPDQLTIKLIMGDPMDDDDEHTGAYYATNDEQGMGFTFSHDAACDFMKHNGLRSIIRGNCYSSNRFLNEDTNDCGRPWHYQHSPNDPGYRLFATAAHSGLPSVVSIFSAPSFCDLNRNTAAFVSLSLDDSKPLAIRQFAASHSRPIQMPGPTASAFSWSMPLMSGLVHSAISNMLHAPASQDDVDDKMSFSEAEKENDQDGRVKRFRRLCRLLSQRPELGGLAALARKGLSEDML